MKHAAAKGFTLIELMIAMALGFLLLAGAFEMHVAFTRQSIHQQETGDMQQALRVAAQVIARSVRTAGTGLNGGMLDLYDANANPSSWVLGAVQFSNPNDFPNGYPNTVYDKVAGDVERSDPDWIRVITFDARPTSNGLVATAAPGCMSDGSCPTLVTALSKPIASGGGGGQILVSDARPFALGSFLFAYNADYTNDPTAHRVCVRRVTNVPVPALDNSGLLVFDNGSPYNPAWGNDLCMNTATRNLNGYNSLASNFAATNFTYVFALDRSVIYRITNADVRTPKLKAWFAPAAGTIPSFYPEAVPNWQTLTENIEDLQVATFMSNGTICGAAGFSTDDATPGLGPCQPQNVRALRFTLVARSSQTIPGWLLGGLANGIEDEAAIGNDAYLRRSLTEEVQVRNIPWGGP